MTDGVGQMARAAVPAVQVLHEVAGVARTREEIRTAIVTLQARIEAAVREHPEAEGSHLFPVRHQFTDGLYFRSGVIPKGLLVVGKIHRHAHLNFISRGRVTMVTEFEGVQQLIGPCTMVSHAGTKRALYTHEDTEWTTVHVTPETDLDKLEAEIIAPTYAAMGLVDPVVLPQLEEG